MMRAGSGGYWRAFWEKVNNKRVVQNAMAELELRVLKEERGSKYRWDMGRARDEDGTESQHAEKKQDT